MEQPGTTRQALPPWNNPAFLTEQGLRDAQEYFFQTHATHSRLIAQGRKAQGFMKGHLRRKLNKEMGEDFKMYTGVSIGEAQAETEESKGIRGQLNELLQHVYLKIAPTQPITSPIQEDLTILRQPLGGLEVLFGISCFYTSLMKRYASLAGESRKVLKSVLDEEVFKWVWRTYYAFLLAESKTPVTFQEVIPSSGVHFIPVEKQRLGTMEKFLEIGEFLLAGSLAQSHLRFPICYYFVNFLRQVQYRLLPAYDRNRVEAVYDKIQQRKPNEPMDDVLVVVDVLMNLKGSSQQAFDDVLDDAERQAQKFVPPPEIAFIESFQEFVGNRFAPSMKKFIPQVSKQEIMEGQGVTLMPILLLLRTLPYEVSERILEKIPGPFLNLLKNRISHGATDDVNKPLLDRIEEMIKNRHKRGEQYTIYGGTGRVASKRDAARASAAESAPAAAKKPAAAPQAAAPQGVAPQAAAPQAAAPPAPAQAVEEGPPLEGEVPPAPASGAVLQERLIVEWQPDNGGIMVYSLAPQDIIDLAGPDVRLLLPWVLFALKTGQVFAVPPKEVSREKVEGLLRDIIKECGKGGQVRLSVEERKALYEQNRGQPPGKVLIDMHRKFHIGAEQLEQAGALAGGISGLKGKLGNQLQAFIMNPNQEGFRLYLEELSGTERQAVVVLNRVAKTR
jgi:hypothetical protein